MRFELNLQRLGLTVWWARELVYVALALAVGFGVVPLLIFYAGSWALGRYEGASAARIYQGIYQGLQGASPACWVVVLGPLGFYLIFKCLRLWWRASTRLLAKVSTAADANLR